ncbi:hypothetical protein JWG42_13960 [Desulfoprunum benzoelyticum]|uniref:Putative nucleic acid-binding Zn-ribbon protein n=1 Tax=Desulfoprunum benzoelyticum TaxID=1506996 RepID=A0A840UTM3_9BACT|nr:hypothetical protein [Desulfoprunum benzoelyticum]MBB5349537.1 putative nucleic acid-binding Zn-ribbon protein [Desulfoprunum benzoelyticum]MBM9531260.1 hypothetical protein [Desulfoprunum benzoelyticum]
MEAVSVPFLPTGLWLLAASGSILILLIIFGMLVYQKRRFQWALKDSRDVSQLASRKELLQADITELRKFITEQNEELARLTSEREEQERIRGELSRLQSECATVDQRIIESRTEIGELENQRYNTAQALEKLNIEVESLKAQRLALEDIQDKITASKKECDQLTVLQELKNSELRKLEQDFREMNAKTESTKYEFDELRKKIDTLRTREPEVDLMNQKMLQLKQEIEDIRNEVSNQQRYEDEARRKAKGFSEDIQEKKGQIRDIEKQIQDLEGQIENKSTEFGKLGQQVGAIIEELSGKQNALAEVKKTLTETINLEKQIVMKIEENKNDIEKLKAEETSLNASIATLKVLAKKYNKSLGVDEGVDSGTKYRDLWHPVTFPSLKPAASFPSEQEMLKKTSNYIKSQNLYFPERVINAFHTALKINDISPLVVLAGISGTGKSELPRRYAEGMGIHTVILAVQPRWDSPQDLFGFYNYLEERYKATELARAMVQFELYNRDQWQIPVGWDHDRSDRMLLVLLDEMNLARVEYYFSEFLSRLETRRGIDLTNPEERAKAEISLEMGSLAEGEKPIRLFPGQNVLFSGTMNEDETTQALSDKVLDRSCVLRFGRPKRISALENVKSIPPTASGLTFEQWRSFLEYDLPSQEKDKVNSWINKLNDAMEKLNRPFGHRVAQAIQRYVANYPNWIPNRVSLAMADQIEQRIMPKLRGIEIGEAEQPLKEIHTVIKDCGDEPLLAAFKQGAQSQQQVFIWRGLDRTEDF